MLVKLTWLASAALGLVEQRTSLGHGIVVEVE